MNKAARKKSTEPEDKKFYETSDFKSLQKEWYSKLKKSGFDDIEIGLPDDAARSQEFTIDLERVVYHEKCLAVLRRGNFKDAIDRYIFERHCEGVSTVKISTALPTVGLKEMSQRSVHYRLTAILKEANITPYKFSF